MSALDTRFPIPFPFSRHNTNVTHNTFEVLRELHEHFEAEYLFSLNLPKTCSKQEISSYREDVIP